MINRIKDPTKKAIQTSSKETWKTYKEKLAKRKLETRKMNVMTKNLLGTKPNGFTKVDQYIE